MLVQPLRKVTECFLAYAISEIVSDLRHLPGPKRLPPGFIRFMHDGRDSAELAKLAIAFSEARIIATDLFALKGFCFALHGFHDVEKRNFVWRFCETVTTIRAGRRCDETGLGQHLEALRQIFFRYSVKVRKGL